MIIIKNRNEFETNKNDKQKNKNTIELEKILDELLDNITKISVKELIKKVKGSE